MWCSRLQQIGLAAALICAPAFAIAQRTPAYQDGTISPNDALKGVTQGRYGKAGGLQGDANGLGQNPHSITDRGAIGLCSNSAATGGEYNALCLGHDPDGTGILSLDSYGGMDPKTFKLRLNGQDYELPGSAAVVGSDAVVAHNTALKGTLGVAGQRLTRLGYAAAGDGGRAEYNWSSSNCSAADDGAQVQPSGGVGCWIADFSGMMPVPEVWGAVGNGSSNDTPALNAGLQYVSQNGGKLYARNGSRYAVGSTVTLPPDTCFIGAGLDASQLVMQSPAFSPMVNMGSRSCLEDIKLDAAPQTASGTVIQMGTSGNDHRALLRRVYTNQGCVAVDVNGSSHQIEGSYFYEMAATGGCGGIRVGHNTTNGATVEFRMSSTVIACNPSLPTRADWGLLFEDSGGALIGHAIDNIGCQYGTIMRPGPSQDVAYTFFNGAVLGDTTQQYGLLINSAGGTVRGNAFNQTWTAASSGKAGIKIQNTGSGSIVGNMFTGHRSYLNFANGVEIDAPTGSGTITETQFDGLRVCGTQTGTDFIVGDNLTVTLQNSRLGKQCDGLVAGNTINLSFGIGLGSNVTLLATNNDLSYSGGEFWGPVSGIPVGDSVMSGNKGVDTGAGPTYASASTVTLLFAGSRMHLTGTTTVNTITPAWNGQELCIISNDGAISFGTSGNIKATNSLAAAGAMVCGHYDSGFSKWYLH